MPRYSQRLPWSFAPNILSRLHNEKRNAQIPVLDLTVSNPTLSSNYPHEAIAAALGHSRDLRYRPSPFGLEPARETIAHLYSSQGYSVDSSNIALTASTSEAYALLFKLLCDPEDEVLIPAPSYPLFEYLASLENVRTIPYPLRYDGSWFIDFEALRNQISPRSRAIVIVNPNNPTGSFLKRDECRQLIELAGEFKLPILSDEVFMSYEFESEFERTTTLVNETAVLSFSLNGLSKMAGMPQLKLAWLTVNGPSGERQEAIERLELVLDTYLSVNTPVQQALSALLRIGAEIRSDLAATIGRNFSRARAVFEGTPVHILHAEGGWSLLLQLPRKLGEEEWLLRLLQEKNVLLQPGFFFDMPSEAYAVASLITEPEQFQQGTERLRDLVDQTTQH